MLKVKFDQIKNVVVMEVLEQSKEDTKNLYEKTFIASNNITIESDEFPEIFNEHRIFVKGNNINDDHLACYSFDNKEDARNFVIKACSAIKEYNQKFSTSLNENTLFSPITTIAE